MARADLLKQLFRAYRDSDRESFMDVARSIADEERKKHHPALAATNFEQALDPALWRRFDEVVRFDRPTEAQIEELLKQRPSPVSNSKVSTKRYGAQLEGSTFGDIERIATDALKSCALEGRTRLQTEDIKSAEVCSGSISSE